MEGPVGAEENYVFAAATAMLQQKERPTATMSGNDEMAIQVYTAAFSLGLQIPQDVSVVGFEDFRTVPSPLNRNSPQPPCRTMSSASKGRNG
jgi:LacI family transcriptional regulator